MSEAKPFGQGRFTPLGSHHNALALRAGRMPQKGWNQRRAFGWQICALAPAFGLTKNTTRS